MNVFPSSIFPALSGQADGAYPSGYNSIPEKQEQLEAGSGLFTGNLADYHQDRSFPDSLVPTGASLKKSGFGGGGINKHYPSPLSYQAGNNPDGTLYGSSGIFVTYPPHSGSPEWVGYDGSKGSGIFNFKELISNFSNAKESREAASGIYDFTIFNDYIHYESPESQAGQSQVESSDVGVAEDGGSILPSANDETGNEIRIPFVADLVPTTQAWDRYKTPEDPSDFDTDPEYETDDGNDEGDGQDAGTGTTGA